MKKWFLFRFSWDGSRFVDIDSGAIPDRTAERNRIFFQQGEEDSLLLIDLPDLVIGLEADKVGLWIQYRKEVT